MPEIEYGLTPKGPNIKRLDVIIDQLHERLSEKFGVNTRQNPESVLNVLITIFADALAEVWEFGEDNYYAKYPTSAEGVDLDNAVQYGGVVRETAQKSYYPIHCKGKDGTVMTPGTIIASDTNPAVQLELIESKEITRSAFNKVEIKVAAVENNSTYQVTINETVYTFTSGDDTALSILNGIKNALSNEDFQQKFTVTLEDDELLIIEAVDLSSSNELSLTENLTTETVTTIANFGTVETGDIFLPVGIIKNIVKADAGLLEVCNFSSSYVAGRKQETDTEIRKSYTDKIFHRSNCMTESIESAILTNVQGVTSVSAYENYTNDFDDWDRPPHSVEVVVEGGDDMQIAKEILKTKAGGISTYGTEYVDVPGVHGETQIIWFNRPKPVYTWYRLEVTQDKEEMLPTNWIDILKNAILKEMGSLKVGGDVVPQRFVSSLYKVCSGISYVDILLLTTTEKIQKPEKNDFIAEGVRSITITDRQRAVTTKDMIEVVFPNEGS